MKNAVNKGKNILKYIITFVILLVFIGASARLAAEAAESVKIVEINYINSTITVQLGATDKFLMMSDAKQKKWELVPINKDSNNRVTFDISWISVSKNYVLSLKGDVSSEPVSVTLPKQQTNFKAKYDTATGKVSFTNAGNSVIEWRKRDGMSWKTVNTATLAEELYGLCANGATVYFRIAPVNGNGTKAGSRASKEVSVTIPKKSAAPSIALSNETLSVAAVKGLQYRTVDEFGNPTDGSEWVTVTKNENITLETLAPQSMCATAAKTTDTYLKFRTTATSSKQISNCVTVKIPAQEALSNDITEGISIKYTSSSTFELEVLAASAEQPFEYCIINQDAVRDGVDITDAGEITWKAVTSSSPVVIDKETDDVDDQSKVYVRRKAVESLGHNDFELASPVVGPMVVNYPGEVSTEGNSFIWLRTISGVCNTDNSNGYLTFALYSPTETTVKSLSFVDYSSKASYGSVAIKSSVALNKDSNAGEDNKYIITTTITSTDSINAHTNKKMLAYITFDGSSVFKSDATKGVGLYIYPASAVNNPKNTADKMQIAEWLKWSAYDAEDDEVEYTTAFSRVYGSNREEDDSSFRVRLDLGTTNIPDWKSAVPGENTLGSTEVLIEKIKYDGVIMEAAALKNGSDSSIKVSENEYFKIEYKTTTTDSNDALRTAVITFYADEIEKNQSIDVRDSNAPIIIYLNNGEILKAAVTMNLRNTATIDKSPIAWALTEGSLDTVKETKITDSNGKTTVTTEKVITYTMDLTLFDSSYEVTVLDVKWNGISVYDTGSVSAGKMNIKLSNAKINAINVDNSTTCSLIIELSNGFSITSGCKLTILPE